MFQVQMKSEFQLKEDTKNQPRGVSDQNKAKSIQVTKPNSPYLPLLVVVEEAKIESTDMDVLRDLATEKVEV